jgi:hypothetical protein
VIHKLSRSITTLIVLFAASAAGAESRRVEGFLSPQYGLVTDPVG